jgi:hypothetical protein
MLKATQPTITREQFGMLRDAKKLVKDEFGEELMLQQANVMDLLYQFALRSRNERLFELFSTLNGGKMPGRGIDPTKISLISNDAVTTKTAARSGPVKIGDIVDGERCVRLYRGSPIFEPL